jgi:hypothetical protein
MKYIIIFLLVCIFSFIISYFILYKKNKKDINKKLKYIGECGIAITKINTSTGVLSIKENDNVRNLMCQSSLGEIRKGSRILVTNYNEDEEIFIVDYYPEDEKSSMYINIELINGWFIDKIDFFKNNFLCLISFSNNDKIIRSRFDLDKRVFIDYIPAELESKEIKFKIFKEINRKSII